MQGLEPREGPRARGSDVNESIFFWLAPSVLAIFACVFAFVAVYDRRIHAARWAAAGFAVGLVSLLADTLRDPQNLVLMAAATALHWTALGLISAAFVSRKGERLPLTYLLCVGLIGAAFLIITSFVHRLPALGTANANLVGAAVQAAALPVLWRRRESALDGLLLGAVLASVTCYGLRGMLFLPQDAAVIEADAGFWSVYNLTFYLTTGALALVSGVVLLMALGGDLIERHYVASETDHLTGLPNRRSFERWIDEAREGKVAFGCAIVADLDHFKRINDRHGHEVGDMALAAASVRLRSVLGDRGRLARIGGEEFAALVYTDCRDHGAALAEELRASLTTVRVDGMTDGLSASFGVAEVVEGHTRAALRAADQAVYAAKDAGRDRVVLAPGPSLRAVRSERAASA